MGSELITGAEILIRSLIDEGVTTVFGYPGGAIMPVYDKLYDYQGKQINHILVRHEQAAAHAAEGYARVSGKVGVAIATSGPGATNTITGIADAMMDSTPMVVITGQVGVGALGTDAFQECDVVDIAQPISKWAYQIRSAEKVAWAVSRAFYIARSGRPGPVVLDFTKNAQTELAEYEKRNINFIRSYQPVPEHTPESIKEAAQLINESCKPLVLVGQGVQLGGAQKELQEFIEKIDAPAGCTLLGLSALPSSHPLNVGMLGMHGSYAVNVKTQECDLLIAVGMRFDDRITGKLSTYAGRAKKIHFDIDPSEINKNVAVDVPVLGDCKETLAEVIKLLKPGNHKAWRESFEQFQKIEEEKVINREIHPAEGPLHMGEVINVVTKATNNEAILVTDVGQNQMMSARYFKFSKNNSIVTSGGMGTMGFGLPAAIGATFAAPERTVCFFTGDGGLQMTIEEFGTIMEQHSPVKIILMNNNYLGNVRQWQQLFFESRYSFTRMMNPDYEKIASAYNIPCRTVIDRKDLADAVKEMIETDGPYLLQTVVAEEENVLPMCCPEHDVDDMLLELK